MHAINRAFILPLLSRMVPDPSIIMAIVLPLSSVSCSYLVVDGEISISCLSGGSEFQATYEVVINGEVSSTLTGESLALVLLASQDVYPNLCFCTGSIGVGTPIIIDTANPDLLSTIVNEIMFILRGSDGSIITQQTLTITSGIHIITCEM